MNQQSLFGDVAGPYRFGSASAERDSILERVERKAEVESPGFTERSSEFFLQYLRRGPASSEEMVDAAKREGIRPSDDRQFGPIVMKLSRAGLIVKDGFCQRKKGHGTSGGVRWRLNTTN